MWMSALMAIVSYLKPKKQEKVEEETGGDLRKRDMYRINEKVKTSIMNAIRIEEQKKLEQIKGRPVMQARSVGGG
jgi:hypothetical protein